MTYYLKYRPQTLQDLDQEVVRNSLVKIFNSKNIPHAYLFSGPRGTGKTSAARIIAKILNCKDLGKDAKPCNKCSECLGITKGDSLDVIELDAASHRGIDDVRQIKEAVKLSPVTAKKKVYIVDEAHMLTTEASNALLKTLEEPPSHVVFILATTNPEKLIGTIRSRVTNIKFKKAGTEEIVSSLKRIAKGEKIKVDDSALKEIATQAEGSFRDAAKTLEQVAAEVDDLSKENVSDFLTNSKSFIVLEFLKTLKDKKAKEAIGIVGSAIDGGMSAKEIVKKVVTDLRQILLGSVGIGESSSNMFSQNELVDLIDLFTRASSEITTSFIEEVPLEVAIIKWCGRGDVYKKKANENQESESQYEEINKNELKTEEAINKSEGKNESKSGFMAKEPQKDVVSTKLDVMIKNNSAAHTNGNGSTRVAVSTLSLENLDNNVWNKILGAVRPASASTEALLRAAKPIGFEGNTLKLGVFYKFHKEHLESNQHRLVLEKTVSDLTGKGAIRVVCELTEPPKKKIEADVAAENVVLSEPNDGLSPNALTNNKSDDIINLAEKVFSS